MGGYKSLLGKSQQNSSKSILATTDSGFKHNDKPVISIAPDKEFNEDSILDSVDAGFGTENKIIKDCPRPKFKTHLCKENYLGEFTEETEKALVRYNIDVYSKKETTQIVSHIIKETSLITKTEVQDMIQDLDFVDSTLKSHVPYNIPNNLFQS